MKTGISHEGAGGMNWALLLALAAFVICVTVVFLVSVQASKAHGRKRDDGTGAYSGISTGGGSDCSPGDTGGCDGGGGGGD
jgi:hypothetical protein